MTPRVSPHLTPLFYDLGALKFQALSRELLHHEPDSAKADEYGRNGQGQRGIDVIAPRKNGGIDVGQSKCEKKFTAKKVQKVADKFFEHWEHWKDKEVHRFVLFLAAEVLDTKLTDEELVQRVRFKKHGIEFIIWNGAVIKSKLRVHRDIARNYIHSEEILDSICGKDTVAPVQPEIAALAGRMAVYSAELEGLKGKELEALRELTRLGEQSKALTGAEVLRNSNLWDGFTPKFRGRVLRFNAAVHLNLRHDPKVAAALVAKAREADPTGDFQIIDSYLRYCEKDANAALEILAVPGNLEARNLRWALLLETGKKEELRKEVALPLAFPADAETHRVLAFLAISIGEVATAKLEIRKGLDLSPANRNVLHAAAIIDYYAGLSPVADHIGRLHWPVPVPWTLVKRDADSIRQFESAAAQFGNFAAHPDCLPSERANARVWRLACLACIDSKQAEAATAVAEYLKGDPTNSGVIVWALFRGYPLNLPELRAALEKRLEADRENVELHFSLWSVLFNLRDATAGMAAVEAAKQFFEGSGNGDLWLFHKVQFVAMSGDKDTAANLAAGLRTPRLRETLAGGFLGDEPLKTKDARKAEAERLAKLYEKTGNVRVLLESCEFHLRINDYSYVATHADRLVEGVGTASALRMALEGAAKHHDYKLCLILLRDHHDLFRDGKLSPDVRALKAYAQHKQGEWGEALQDAESAYREDPSLASFFTLFQLLLQSGDTRRCATLSRDLLGMRTVKPLHFLQAATVTLAHDLSLAQELWRRANQPPIKKLELAAASMDLAYRLGLPAEADGLLKRLTKAAAKGKGPLRMKSMEDLMGIVQQSRKQQDEVVESYMKGELAIHLVSEQMNSPLSMLFRRNLEANRAEPNLFRTPIIFLRAGNLPLQSAPSKPLLADVTGLTVAADLGILDKVESTFRPLYISPNVTTCLADQVQKLRSSQPDRQAAREEFLHLIEASKITVVKIAIVFTAVSAELAKRIGPEYATLLETANKENGVVLTDGPIIDAAAPHDPVDLPPATAGALRHRRDLESHLRAEPGNATPWLPLGTAILVPHSLVAGLNRDLMGDATQRFRLMVTEETVRQLKEEIVAYQQTLRLAEWTQLLADRIHQGITSGIYKVVPAGRPIKGERQWTPVSRTLLDVLSFKDVPEAVFWCDDRFFNRHQRVEERPIIGISEVLFGLHKKGALTVDEYFAALIHLRRSNARYLPTTDEEILYHLRQAPVIKGAVQENLALATLRRYFAVCMLDKDRLAGPVQIEGQPLDSREFEFPLSIRRETDSAMLKIWNDESVPDEIRTARANWIFDQLFVDILGFRQCLIGTTTKAEVRDLTGMMIGSLLAEGVGLHFRKSSDGIRLTPRAAFFVWITERLLTPMTERDPDLVKVIARPITNLIVTQLTEKVTTSPEYRKGQRAMFAHLIHDLPPEVSSELDLPANIQLELGMTTFGPSIGMDDHFYATDKYWAAIVEAVNGRKADLKERKGGYVIEVSFAHRTKNGRVVLQFTHQGKETGRYSDSALGILQDSTEERVRFLSENRHWFDGPSAETKAAIDGLAVLNSPQDRMEKLHAWRDNSTEYAYRRIEDRFTKSDGGFGWNDVRLPDWRRLHGHLRLSQLPIDLAKSGETLLAEEGLSEALRRMICFPVKLPALLEQGWRDLDDTAAASIFNDLRRSSSLVADLHLVRLANMRNSADFETRATTLLEAILNLEVGRTEFQCFRTILELVDADFGQWTEALSTLPACRVACVWYHASRLHGYLRNLGGGSERLLPWLSGLVKSWTEETMLRPEGYWLDCARPSHVSFGRLVLHGLAHLLGDSPNNLASRINITEQLEGKRSGFIRLDLIRSQGLWTNSLGTFLGGASDNQIVALYGPDCLMNFFATLGEDVIASIVEDLAKEPLELKHWAVLRGVAGEGNLPGATAASTWEVLKSLDFDRLADLDVDDLAGCLTFACQQASNSRDPALVAHVEKAVFSLSRKIDLEIKTEDPDERPWLRLMNALVFLAVVPGDEVESGRRLFDYLRRFAIMCPIAGTGLHGTATAWMRQMPMAQQTNLWPFLLTSRALR